MWIRPSGPRTGLPPQVQSESLKARCAPVPDQRIEAQRLPFQPGLQMQEPLEQRPL